MVILAGTRPLHTRMVPGISSRDRSLLPMEEAGLLGITERTGMKMDIDVAVPLQLDKGIDHNKGLHFQPQGKLISFSTTKAL